MNWYYVQDSDRVGPVDGGEFERLVAAGRIQPETLVWNETLPGWTPLRDARPGAAAATSTPSPAPIDSGSSAPVSTCSQCGQSFSPDQLMHFEGRTICFNCKPLFVARMKEGIAPATAVTYAGFWIRFLAVLIDGAIAFTVGMLIGLIFGTRGVGRGAPFTASGCISSLLQILYGVGYETLLVGAYGATLGKMALRLKVVTPEGGKVSYMTALGRYFAKILSAIILGIGYIMAAFDDEKRALHDRICNTRVIRT